MPVPVVHETATSCAVLVVSPLPAASSADSVPAKAEPESHRDHDAEVVIESDDDDDGADADPSAPLRFRLSWRKLWRFAGPGWLMSLAYLDPGNLESDLQQGAYTSTSLVWVLFLATIMGLILQEMSARLGIVTGRDLAQTVRRGYPRWLTYVIYVNMEIAVIGSDIQEVVGTGVALYLITNKAVPVWVGCLITGADTFTFLAVQYLGVRYLEAFIAVLISTMSICFFVNWGLSGGSDVGELVHGWLVPEIKPWAISQAVGTIGAVIMPHNLYLHSGLVLSRKISRHKPQRVHEAIWYTRIEAAGALAVAFMVNLAIVAVNATNFYDEKCAQLPDGPLACMTVEAYRESGQANGSQAVPCGGGGATGDGRSRVCGDFGLESEGYALGSQLGWYTLYLWAIGLFAAGQAATMVCTFAGQIIMGGCLEIQLRPWVRVAFTRIFALGPALAVAAATYSDQRLFNAINQYLNILQSIQLPFAMLPVLHFAAQDDLLGRFRSGLALSTLSTLLALLVLTVCVVLVCQFVTEFSTAGHVAVGLYGVFYASVCARMVGTEIVAVAHWAARLLTCGYYGSRARPRPSLPLADAAAAQPPLE